MDEATFFYRVANDCKTADGLYSRELLIDNILEFNRFLKAIPRERVVPLMRMDLPLYATETDAIEFIFEHTPLNVDRIVTGLVEAEDKIRATKQSMQDIVAR